MTSVPSHARAIVIGGGIIGCSTAYHLAKLGWKDVVLLERAKLTSGSTFHAAGLVGQLRNSANITQLLGHSVSLYAELEKETGLSTGWRRTGGLRLACSEARMIELKRQVTTARSFGLEMHVLSPKEAQDLWPVMALEGVVGAVFLPSDGQANPSDITQALARGARMHGAKIIEDCPVTSIERDANGVTGVTTPFGKIGCETIILCAGQWTREVAAQIGVNVPLVSVEHQYLITEPIAGVTRDLPTMRDPDNLIYFREEVGGLTMGGYEPNPKPWAVDGIPEGFHFTLLNNDVEHFEQIMERAIMRVPAFETVGIKDFINGPESFTPDGNFILGEAPECPRLYVGAGFNAFGIASAGGAGKALAEWAAAGEQPYDLWPVDIRRFGRPHRDVDWVRARTLELYGKHYSIGWPGEEHSSGRPLRRSPLYDRLKAAGSVFGEKLGWERPNWFERNGEERVERYSFARPNWFEAVGYEHKAARERAALFDQTSFAKFMLVGRDAAAALDWICSNHVTKAPGTLIYTQMLNAKGGIECDLTVARLAEERFYIVTGTGFATHDFDWISRNIPKGMDAQLVDVTSGYATLALMGPLARNILARVTRDDISNGAFPFAHVRGIVIAGAPVLALRVTYVGELGWELHIPTEFALSVYDALKGEGEEFGLVDAGYRAIESLRLEKGYRAWGAEIGPDHSPFEAGLGWAVKLKKGTPFMGREALVAEPDAPLKKLMACFTVADPDVSLWGRETILRDGERVGWLTSGGWGYTVGKNIGYGFVRRASGVDRDFILDGHYELEVATDRVPCDVHLEALYDPTSARVRA
ncbi:MAG: FAD-dependent oxidoreductase [Parvibaculum sp.]|uniref:GcvT family protein n=1 Tax=Parvibaculum sp. TaxID=2024848 RepID=UPI0025E17D4C|nr:FAD-dependent oxidoreductase [Parvibaculum sp.]MCE9648983.1 FAD-dependent oxidoreductase [Parvibaculum sp.]